MIPEISSWCASLITISGTYFTGRVSLWGPALGMVAVVPWLVFAVHGHHWGMLPVNAVVTYLHIKNFKAWKKEGRTWAFRKTIPTS